MLRVSVGKTQYIVHFILMSSGGYCKVVRRFAEHIHRASALRPALILPCVAWPSTMEGPSGGIGMIRERVDPQVKVRYLTLNVFSQAIADHLVGLPSEPSEETKTLLDEAVKALESIGSGGALPPFKTHHGLRPFNDYEQLTTLYEVLAPSSRSEALARIKKLRSDLQQIRDRPAETNPTLIDELREDFRKVAIEALRRSRRPTQGIPHRVVELCRNP